MDPNCADLVELLVLHCLEGRPLHGYAVYKELSVYFGDELTNGRIYSVLNRLEDDDLVQRRDGEGRRRIYSLTSRGEALISGIREGDPALAEAVADLFGLGDRPSDEPTRDVSTGPWRDITIHRDLVRDRIEITLERGEGGAPPEVERLLDDLLEVLFG